MSHAEKAVFRDRVLGVRDRDLKRVSKHRQCLSKAHAQMAACWQCIMVLEVASNGDADCIVTHNLRDFAPALELGMAVAAFARERDEVLVAAGVALDAPEAVFEQTALQVIVELPLDECRERSAFGCERPDSVSAGVRGS